MSVEDPLTQEELHCTQSPILKNVTLRGGIKAGNFSDLGDEKNMHMCIALCCERKTCDLAFMIGGTCIAVDCFSEELCQAVKARPTIYDPQIAFIRRRELQRPNPTPNPSLSRKGRYFATSHGTGRIFDRLKNLTGHFVHTETLKSLCSHETDEPG